MIPEPVVEEAAVAGEAVVEEEVAEAVVVAAEDVEGKKYQLKQEL